MRWSLTRTFSPLPIFIGLLRSRDGSGYPLTMRSVDLVEQALAKIATIDHSGYELRSVLAISPTAISEAMAYDSEGKNLPLMGQPVLIKDNIEAIGLPCSAGSLALMDTPTVRDASLVSRIKDAGGIIIGSTNLSEWANIRSTNSTSGWSAVGGLTANPWVHNRSTAGSSSGSGAAVAAGLVKFAVGSETDGSITSPACVNGCVGIKPTVGTIPRDGMVPISGSQDSPGPMTQTVSEAALLLSVMTGHSVFMDALMDSSKIKIGVVKSWLTKHEGTNQLFESALDKLRESGFQLVDIELPTPATDVFLDEFSVMKHELFSDLETYLVGRNGARVKSLSDIIEFNKLHLDTELQYFDQNIFDQALILGGRNTAYSEVRKRNLEWAENLLNQGLANVDVLIGCSFAIACESRLGEGDDFSNASWITRAPSIAGTPIGSLPMGITDGLPTGMGLVVNRHQDAVLVKAMSQIEKALDLGVLVPTFIKNPVDETRESKASKRAEHPYLPNQ